MSGSGEGGGEGVGGRRRLGREAVGEGLDGSATLVPRPLLDLDLVLVLVLVLGKAKVGCGSWGWGWGWGWFLPGRRRTSILPSLMTAIPAES